jgi:hypothetical protein
MEKLKNFANKKIKEYPDLKSDIENVIALCEIEKTEDNTFKFSQAYNSIESLIFEYNENS